MLSYEECVTGPNKQQWKKAIEEEKKPVQKNNTWKLINPEKVRGKEILTSKWILKMTIFF